jgi:hypothetical protein
MRKFWTVKADFTVEADSKDEAIQKYFDNVDVTYDGIWSTELAWEEENDD